MFSKGYVIHQLCVYMYIYKEIITSKTVVKIYKKVMLSTMGKINGYVHSVRVVIFSIASIQYLWRQNTDLKTEPNLFWKRAPTFLSFRISRLNYIVSLSKHL